VLVEGCTIAINPDGENNNVEWCDVEESEVGRPWGYCAELFQYD